MKKKILFLALIFNLGMYAQNWNPISLNNYYNYKIDTTHLITNVIFVDSISLNNSDTTFYLNRIMTNCDTCSMGGYKLINQPQFFMKRVLKKGTNLFIFQDPSEFKIYPLKNHNETWVFDSTNSINAFVDSVYTETLFGVNDSIKRINLSDGNKIILSKTFGIMQFPYKNGYNYKLIGIKNNSAKGQQLPTFLDFFNYEVNDILQWRNFNVCGGPGAANTTIYTKATVISKTINGDTIHYQIQGIEKKDHQYYVASVGWMSDPTIYTPINKTLTYLDSSFHFSNSYPNQVHNYPFMGRYLNTNTIFKEENGLQKKIIDFTAFSYWNTPPATNFEPLRPYGNNPPYSKKTTFTNGLGVCIKNNYATGCYYEDCMQGRIHLGDTIGFIYPDSFYVVGIEEINDKKLIIYPNPTSDFLTIIQGQLSIIEIKIMDITGKTIKSVKQKNDIVDVSDLNAGIYFIKIITAEKTIIKKFVKQ